MLTDYAIVIVNVIDYDIDYDIGHIYMPLHILYLALILAGLPFCYNILYAII